MSDTTCTFKKPPGDMLEVRVILSFILYHFSLLSRRIRAKLPKSPSSQGGGVGAVWNLGSFIKLCDTRLPGRNCMMGKGWDVFNLESEVVFFHRVYAGFHAFASPYWTGHAH